MTTEEYLIKRHKIDTNDEPPYFISGTRWKYLVPLFKKIGATRGVEIGVEHGEFSKHLCKSVRDLALYSIDPWLSYEYLSKVTQAKMDKNYQDAVSVLSPFPNSTIIRAKSADAVEQFDDESLDFVYIDGNHDFQYAYQDIELWERKVKVGGIVSGDDYFNSRIPGRCRVKDAVDKWTREHEIAKWFILVGSWRPNWFWVK